MILDDLDRVHAGGELLHFLELAARRCKLLIASANCADNMMGAALRPGRFDDVVRVERLDREVLRRLLGSDEDLCERLSTLPVAYLAEFLKRRRVLGRAVALAELEELSARCAKLNQRTDGGN
jgi:SpoVK/Ycf46/Vps4 family AAA+-type ATPase